MDIARAIYNLRVNKEWSQQELADKLFVSRDLVSKWETRQRRPDWQTIEKIAEIFCVQTSVIADKNELLF
ncbi:MAG: helix-turn-helix transcriptional regulator, partial [Clostridiales bacterium]|nr:helix-turn-helix transcriptional regulator [Clostridiales bacterium]